MTDETTVPSTALSLLEEALLSPRGIEVELATPAETKYLYFAILRARRTEREAAERAGQPRSDFDRIIIRRDGLRILLSVGLAGITAIRPL